MSNLPSGTVTFLFTDLVGSTRLWEEQPEQMGKSLVEHDEALREAVEAAGGVVFKTVGDAFCAVFGDPHHALNAAISAQLRLATVSIETSGGPVPLRCRMAIHTGVAQERDGDYFGPVLNRVARLLGTGHGGQILLSLAAAELVRDTLPSAMELQSLGDHQLKDLGRPESVFQLCHHRLPREFPPLRSLDNPELPNNLPRQPTSFIGRERELSELHRLLAKTQLLTLTGSGGCGKTRLALQLAADRLDPGSDGVWFVELAPVKDEALAIQAVAAVLGVRDEPTRSLKDSVIGCLRAKQSLLLLDNCEHVIDVCASLATQILQTCPGVKLVATSREGMGISGELTYRVPSLSLPDQRRDSTPERLCQFEAVRLFVERAEFHNPAFTVTNENAPALASICCRLDGIPLAIELAAARMRSMPLEQLEMRLGQRFRLLTGGSRTALPRQQTLRSLVDWSYDLLGPSEKLLLCRLSVFSGSWSLDAAERICGDDVVESGEILDVLTSLVDKSLVSYLPMSTEQRYSLLETIREYARDRLRESGDEAFWRDRHLAYYVDFAEGERPSMGTTEASKWSNIEVELDNLRGALDWAESNPDAGEAGLRLCASIARVWFVRGHLREGRDRCATALAHPGAGAATVARAKTLNHAGCCNSLMGEHAAAVVQFNAAIRIYRDLGKDEYLPQPLSNLAIIARMSRDHASAIAYLEEALDIARRHDDSRSKCHVLSNLGNLCVYSRRFADARIHLAEALELDRMLGDPYGETCVRWNLALLETEIGNLGEARKQAELAIGICLQDDCPVMEVECVEILGRIDAQTGRLDRAAELWAAAAAHRERCGTPMDPEDLLWFTPELAGLKAAMGEALFQEAWRRGTGMTLRGASLRAGR